MKFSAKKSVLGTMGGGLILWIIFSVLIIPLIILIFKIISIKSYTLTIDGTKITEHGGIFNKYDHQTLLTNVVGVDVSQTFSGRIFGYGNVPRRPCGQERSLAERNQTTRQAERILTAICQHRKSQHIADELNPKGAAAISRAFWIV